MQAYQSASHFIVEITATDARDFNTSWPCSLIPVEPCALTFDMRNGDLIDVSNEHWRDCSDESLALSDQALTHGIKALKLESLYWRAGMAHDNRQPVAI